MLGVTLLNSLSLRNYGVLKFPKLSSGLLHDVETIDSSEKVLLGSLGKRISDKPLGSHNSFFYREQHSNYEIKATCEKVISQFSLLAAIEKCSPIPQHPKTP